MKSLVIAYGNPLRGDDGVGWIAARELETARDDGMELEILTCQQLVPELAEKISRAGTVYFVDATTSGVPGEWKCQPISEYNAASVGHFATPGGLLSLAHSLCGIAPTAYLCTVCGDSFEYGEELSPVVAAAVPSVVSAIKDHLMGAPASFPFR